MENQTAPVVLQPADLPPRLGNEMIVQMVTLSQKPEKASERCARDVLRFLAVKQRRFTCLDLRAEMESAKAGNWSQSTVDATCAWLCRGSEAKLDNDKDNRGRGYGLRDWDEEFDGRRGVKGQVRRKGRWSSQRPFSLRTRITRFVRKTARPHKLQVHSGAHLSHNPDVARTKRARREMNTQASSEIPGDLITPNRAARIVKVHISTIHRWIQTSKVCAWRRGLERYLVSEADVRKMVAPYVPPPLPTKKGEARA